MSHEDQVRFWGAVGCLLICAACWTILWLAHRYDREDAP